MRYVAALVLVMGAISVVFATLAPPYEVVWVTRGDNWYVPIGRHFEPPSASAAGSLAGELPYQASEDELMVRVDTRVYYVHLTALLAATALLTAAALTVLGRGGKGRATGRKREATASKEIKAPASDPSEVDLHALVARARAQKQARGNE